MRSFHVPNVIAAVLGSVLARHAAPESRLTTDDSITYRGFGWNFADHGRVTHSKGEYVSSQDPTIHTNTVEGYFSVFKRGMRGTYQHCKEKHLHRYLAEFDFRYNNRVALGVDDETRASKMIKGAQGKRLTYRTTGRA